MADGKHTERTGMLMPDAEYRCLEQCYSQRHHQISFHLLAGRFWWNVSL